MVKEQQGQWVVPNPQIPRSLGLMNIIFGSIMLLTAIGYGFAYAFGPNLQKQFQAPMKLQLEKQKTERAEKIAELKKQEAAAKTEAEKQEFADERMAIEAKPVLEMTAFEDLQNLNALKEPRLAIYYTFEILASVILNVLQIVAGGGLMALAEWARRLSIRVAQLKMLRWLAMVVTTLVMILPMGIEKMQKGMAALESQIQTSGGAAPPFSLSTVMRWAMMFGAVMMIFGAIIACVYPALEWWYLSRPAARAACMKQPQPESPEADPLWETTV
jgi:hypothetical protein